MTQKTWEQIFSEKRELALNKRINELSLSLIQIRTYAADLEQDINLATKAQIITKLRHITQKALSNKGSK